MKIVNLYPAFIAVFSLSFLEANPLGTEIKSQPPNSNMNIADRLSLRYSGCEENSCMNRSNLDSYKECQCDESCSFYGSCCFDALSRDSTKRRKDVQCLSLSFNFLYVYAVVSCPENWSGPSDINERCISPDDYKEYIESYLPVTDPVTKLSYRNRFCAACNENNDTVEWSLNFRCPTRNSKQTNFDEDSVIRSLVYNETLRSWGFFHEDENEKEFVFCDVTYLVPEEMEKKPILCKRVFYSKCSESWPNDEVRQLCDDFLDPVYVLRKGWHRNIYCAHCNYEDKDFNCPNNFTTYYGYGGYGGGGYGGAYGGGGYGGASGGGGYGGASGGGIPFYYTINLHMKFEDFKNIREESCGSNEKYDKRFKKCRKIRL